MNRSHGAIAAASTTREGERSLLERPAAMNALAIFGVVFFVLAQWTEIAAALNLVFPDPDDGLRLLVIRDLIAGQGWFDTHQYRYLPPEGVLLHWSRLVDAPIAALILMLEPFMGEDRAEAVVTAGWPLALFVVYAGVIRWAALRLLGAGAMAFAVLTACQMVVFTDLFSAGRLDHHNVQCILLLGATACFALAEEERRLAAVSGALAALSLAVGLEALPFVAGIGVAYVFAWVFGGSRQAPALSRFSITLALVSVAAFAAQTAPALWLTPACDALSAPWLLLTCGAGLLGGGLAAATPWLDAWRPRLVAAAAGGGLLIAVLALGYPDCLGGPYYAVPEPFRAIWLNDIAEAFPFRRMLVENPMPALQAVGPLVVAALAATVAAARTEARLRRLMALSALLLWTGALLAQLQIRGVYLSSTAIPLVAGWLIDGAVRSLLQPEAARRRSMALLPAAVLVLTPAWTVAGGLAARADNSPKARVESSACLSSGNVGALAALPPGIILSQLHLSPQILFRTDHAIITGGYHRAVDGIVAAIEAFDGTEADMRRIAERYGADYLVICPVWAFDARRPPSFAQRLLKGGTAGWLQPVALDAGPLRVWRVTAN